MMLSRVTRQQNKTWCKVRPGIRGKCIKESNDHDLDVDGKDNYTFRPLSKIVFAMIFIPCLSYLTYSIAMLPNTSNDIESNLRNTTICSNICKTNIEAISNKVT